jgi:tetratricopeptide (TPR) repeat protein
LNEFLESDHQLPATYDVEAFNNLLTAQFELRDSAGLRRTAELAAARGALSAPGYMALGQDAEARGEIDQAITYYERTLDPSLPLGFTSDVSVGGWRSLVRVALSEVQRGGFDRSLSLLEEAYAQAPTQQLANIASDAARVALMAGQPARGEPWLRRAADNTGDNFEAQLQLLHLGVELARLQPDAKPALGSPQLVEQAIAGDDWQLAYEATLVVDLTWRGAIAGIVFVAAKLREEGAPDAALDLLGRGIETGTGSEKFYLLLVQTLRDLGRFDEALEVLELLNSSAAKSPLAA